METKSAQLACTASGMAFEEWRNRPVYRVHCATFGLARLLCNVSLVNGQGYASVLGGADVEGLSTFRALAPYRTAKAQHLRSRVACHLREQRAT